MLNDGASGLTAERLAEIREWVELTLAPHNVGFHVSVESWAEACRELVQEVENLKAARAIGDQWFHAQGWEYGVK